PMATRSGIDALYRAFASDQDQILVFEGDGASMRERLLGTPAPSAAVAAPRADTPRPQIDTSALRRKLVDYLLHDISQTLKVRSAELDADAELSEYGFDSISLTEFANRLNTTFEIGLMPTIFFEFP